MSASRQRSHHPPVVAFFGLFGVGNFGNEASLRAAHEALRALDPAARFICIAEVPDRVAAEHGLPSFSNKIAGPLTHVRPGRRWVRGAIRPIIEVARWISAILFLRHVDVVVVPGTGILDDFGMQPWQMPLDLLRWSASCRLTRTPLLYVSIGAGPIHRPSSRRLLKASVACANYCSFRDEASREFMASIGRDVRDDPVYPDLAFSLPRPPLQLREHPTFPLDVGVGVMAYRGWAAKNPRAADIESTYVDDMARFCRLLLGAGHRVALLTGEDWDEPVMEKIRAAIDADGGAEGLTVSPASTMDDVLRTMATTDLVVATRFHNVVAALMMCRPVVSVGYARKNEDLLEQVGLAGCSSRVEGLSVDVLHDQFCDVARRIEQLRGPISRADAEFSAALSAQYDLIVHQFIERTAPVPGSA